MTPLATAILDQLLEAPGVELVLGDGLPPVEIAVPLELALQRGDSLRVRLLNARIFPAR